MKRFLYSRQIIRHLFKDPIPHIPSSRSGGTFHIIIFQHPEEEDIIVPEHTISIFQKHFTPSPIVKLCT